MNKFWDFENNEMYLNGTISETSWFDDDVTPQIFHDELEKHTGDITVWINSPGGDVFAANQMYNMLKNHNGKITVKIDSLAASAATIVAMAGDRVEISTVGMFMIHNPSTAAVGDKNEMQKAIEILDEVKENIINAYMTKTHLSHNKISQLMDDETWMNSKKAIELGFADSFIEDSQEDSSKAESFKTGSAMNDFLNKAKGRKISDMVSDLYRQKYGGR